MHNACITADYAGGQPASAWPLAGQPCEVDCDLHTIARAHNNAFFVRLIGTIGPRVAAVECVIIQWCLGECNVVRYFQVIEADA